MNIRLQFCRSMYKGKTTDLGGHVYHHLMPPSTTGSIRTGGIQVLKIGRSRPPIGMTTKRPRGFPIRIGREFCLMIRHRLSLFVRIGLVQGEPTIMIFGALIIGRSLSRSIFGSLNKAARHVVFGNIIRHDQWFPLGSGQLQVNPLVKEAI